MLLLLLANSNALICLSVSAIFGDIESVSIMD